MVECKDISHDDIEYELKKLYWKKQNHLTYKFIDNNDSNKTNCWCCHNYIVIHYSNIDNFIKKYFDNNNNVDKNNNENIKIRPSSKLIKILYRLHPEYFDSYDTSKIKYLKNINRSYLTNDSYKYVFDNYFNCSHIDFSVNLDYYTCTICQNNLCNLHMTLNPYYSSKCSYCKKYWNLCLWCKNKLLTRLFDKKKDKLIYEKSLCNIFHK